MNKIDDLRRQILYDYSFDTINLFGKIICHQKVGGNSLSERSRASGSSKEALRAIK